MGGCIPSCHPLDPPLTLNCRNHQKSLTNRYFSHLETLILFFFTNFVLFLLKGGVKRGVGAWHNVPLNVLLPNAFRLHLYGLFKLVYNNNFCILLLFSIDHHPFLIPYCIIVPQSLTNLYGPKFYKIIPEPSCYGITSLISDNNQGGPYRKPHNKITQSGVWAFNTVKRIAVAKEKR